MSATSSSLLAFPSVQNGYAEFFVNAHITISISLCFGFIELHFDHAGERRSTNRNDDHTQ